MRGTCQAHAAAHIDVGGYMKGGAKAAGHSTVGAPPGACRQFEPAAPPLSLQRLAVVYGARAARLVRAPPRPLFHNLTGR